MAIFPSYINESERLMRVRPEQLDALWKEGWRHFGTHFYRYSWALHQDQLCMVVPLRVVLEGYEHNKKFRKIIKKNARFKTVIQTVDLNDEKHALFHKHKQKFTHTIPKDIFVFLSHQPDKIPNQTLEVCVYDTEGGKDKLIACSFMDEGSEATSSVYGMYDPDYAKYSLGTYTMLLEIEYSKQQNKRYYYHGYSYDLPSMYDYKKRFDNIEAYDWSKWRDTENIFMKNLPKRIYHIVSLSDWHLPYYQKTKIAPPGEFIHCSYAEQVARSANKYFSDQDSVLVLHIAPERVPALIKDEAAPDGNLFPHIYGKLPRMAVFKMTEISKNKEGLFEFEEIISE